MSQPIDMRPEKNIARLDAFRQAQYRANREQKPMVIFVRANEPYNTWFVRSVAEGTPDNAQRIADVAPEETPKSWLPPQEVA